jgi:hypothetical protein
MVTEFYKTFDKRLFSVVPLSKVGNCVYILLMNEIYDKKTLIKNAYCIWGVFLCKCFSYYVLYYMCKENSYIPGNEQKFKLVVHSRLFITDRSLPDTTEMNQNAECSLNNIWLKSVLDLSRINKLVNHKQCPQRYRWREKNSLFLRTHSWHLRTKIYSTSEVPFWKQETWNLESETGNPGLICEGLKNFRRECLSSILGSIVGRGARRTLSQESYYACGRLCIYIYIYIYIYIAYMVYLYIYSITMGFIICTRRHLYFKLNQRSGNGPGI